MSAQVLELRQRQEDIKGFKTENLFYQSVNWLSADSFGPGRLVREVTGLWIQGKLEHAGQRFSATPPELTQAELDAVPGAAASLGSWDAIQFEVLERANDSLVIKKDEHRYWTGQGGQIGEEYERLQNQHALMVKNVIMRPGNKATDEIAAIVKSEPEAR